MSWFGSRDRFPVEVSLMVVRVAAGIIFAAHGAQKLFGAFGGLGLTTTVEKLEVGPLGYLVVIGEFFGGVGLILGILTRFSATSLILIMLGAIAMVHGKNGFFLSAGGFEYNLALIGLLVPTVLSGPGLMAVGKWLPMGKSKLFGRTNIFLE